MVAKQDRRFTTHILRIPPSLPVAPCASIGTRVIVPKRMASAYKSGQHPYSSSREVVVVVVPPVDELDLVGPLQVFNSVNRLAGRTIYAIEVATNANGLAVKGEGGVLTFLARHHFSRVVGGCDSILLVCGLVTRSVRDPALSAWLNKMAVDVRRLGAVCAG